MVVDERGQASILVVGCALVAFATAGVAVDGTRAYLERSRLQRAADAASLAAADRLDAAAYRSSGGRILVLDAEAARAEALRSLGDVGAGVRGSIEATSDGVAVRLSSSVDTTFLGLLGIGDLHVEARSRARPIAGSVPR